MEVYPFHPAKSVKNSSKGPSRTYYYSSSDESSESETEAEPPNRRPYRPSKANISNKPSRSSSSSSDDSCSSDSDSSLIESVRPKIKKRLAASSSDASSSSDDSTSDSAESDSSSDLSSKFCINCDSEFGLNNAFHETDVDWHESSSGDTIKSLIDRVFNEKDTKQRSNSLYRLIIYLTNNNDDRAHGILKQLVRFPRASEVLDSAFEAFSKYCLASKSFFDDEDNFNQLETYLFILSLAENFKELTSQRRRMLIHNLLTTLSNSELIEIVEDFKEKADDSKQMIITDQQKMFYGFILQIVVRNPFKGRVRNLLDVNGLLTCLIWLEDKALIN